MSIVLVSKLVLPFFRIYLGKTFTYVLNAQRENLVSGCQWGQKETYAFLIVEIHLNVFNGYLKTVTKTCSELWGLLLRTQGKRVTVKRQGDRETTWTKQMLLQRENYNSN